MTQIGFFQPSLYIIFNWGKNQLNVLFTYRTERKKLLGFFFYTTLKNKENRNRPCDKIASAVTPHNNQRKTK